MAKIPPAIILAGGLGTRLRAVVADRPKVLALVQGRPFLEWVLLDLKRQGLQEVVLATGYLAEAVAQRFGDGNALGLSLVYSAETQPLGTAGALRQAASKVEAPRFLVLNGDSMCRWSLCRLLEDHAANRAPATLWLVPESDSRRFGAVAVDDAGQVTSFVEKGQASGSGLVSAGIYLVEREMIDTIPPGRPVSLEREVFPAFIGKGLHGVVGTYGFLDIGIPESYAQADAFIHDEWQLWHRSRSDRTWRPRTDFVGS